MIEEVVDRVVMIGNSSYSYPIVCVELAQDYLPNTQYSQITGLREEEVEEGFHMLSSHEGLIRSSDILIRNHTVAFTYASNERFFIH